VELLTVRHLTVGYGDLPILQDIELTVQAREFVTIIGPNGSGKSTLLRTLGGLLRPTSGEISFMGKPFPESQPAKIGRAGIAYVPQVENVFPSLTVRDNLQLAMPFRLGKHQQVERLETVLKQFPILRARLKQSARTLSGGERQMLAFARALVDAPSLLMLDEPTAGVAPIVVSEILQHIKRINSAGTAILLVEQNAAKAMQVSDRVYLFEGGRNALEGPPEELMRDPKLFQLYLGARK